LEPLFLACEGRMVILAPQQEAEKILDVLHTCPYSENAALIGEVTEDHAGEVILRTEIGSLAVLPTPGGELLPRIC